MEPEIQYSTLKGPQQSLDDIKDDKKNRWR